MHDHYGTRYINTGDWVESCTAIVEHHDGNFELIRWTEMAAPSEGTRLRRSRKVA
jgi:UDP-2,3-diacylglucosamine pyrophosphatase LpxH